MKKGELIFALENAAPATPAPLYTDGRHEPILLKKSRNDSFVTASDICFDEITHKQ